MSQDKEKSFKSYSFTLPSEVAVQFDSYLNSEFLGTSEYIRRLVIADLKQEKLL